MQTVSQSSGEAGGDILRGAGNQVQPGTWPGPHPSAAALAPPPAGSSAALPTSHLSFHGPRRPPRSGARVSAAGRGEGRRREPGAGAGAEAPAGLGCRRQLPEQLSGACSGERSQSWAARAQAPPPSPGPPPSSLPAPAASAGAPALPRSLPPSLPLR